MPAAAKNLSTFLHKAAPHAALAAAVFAAYANVYGNAFLFDDEIFIVNNALLRGWGSIGAILTSSSTAGVGGSDLFYRPLQTLIYLVFYQSFGLSAITFHLLNVSLHAAAACLLYALGRKLDFRPGAVFLAALIWALHPLNTEAVTYISGTVEPLYACFCLLGILVLLPDFSPRKFLYAAPLYALALSSKESAIIFPLLAMSTQFLASKRRLDPKIYLRAWPLWLTAAAYLLLRHVVLGGGYEFYKHANIYTEHASYRIYTFLATLPVYARLLVVPTGLHIDRGFPVYIDPWHWDVIAGAAMIGAALGQIAWGRGRRGLPLGWGLLWFASAHVLHTGVLLPVNGFIFEHWMYLPAAGLFLGAAQTIAAWLHAAPRRQKFGRPVAVLAALAALMLGARAFDQNTVWRDPVTFYSWIVAQGTHSVSIYNNLGNAYAAQGDTPRAIKQFRAAIGLYDEYPQTHHNLALALLLLPDRNAHVDEAIAELRRAISLDPDFFESYEMLANIYAWRGDGARESVYRARAAALREKFNIPANEYAQPRLAPDR